MFKSMKDAAMGALFTDDTPKKPAPQLKVAETTPQPPAATTQVEAVSASDTLIATKLADALLVKVMEKPTAYTALVEAMIPLASFIPDEGARHKAAFAIVGKTRTLEQMVSAIDNQHAQVIDTQVDAFRRNTVSRLSTEIAERATKLKELDQAVVMARNDLKEEQTRHEARVTELNMRIANSQLTLAETSRSLEDSKVALATQESEFASAVTKVKANLELAKSNLIKYLN